MRRKYFIIIALGFFMSVGLFLWNYKSGVIKHLLNSRSCTVIIDAGHGGFDPGKVGINKALEKDINLSIAFKLKKLLEQNDINVIMTREDKHGLYKDTDQDKKRADLKKRVSIINNSDAVIAVSIHQNSFSQESSWGAQVFYYEISPEGKTLAETIQETMKESLKDGNHRLARPNRSYFMLKYTNIPLVIVECGFLSNRREADLLCQMDYQDKMAWAIHLGILEYLNNHLKNNKLISSFSESGGYSE